MSRDVVEFSDRGLRAEHRQHAGDVRWISTPHWVVGGGAVGTPGWLGVVPLLCSASAPRHGRVVTSFTPSQHQSNAVAEPGSGPPVAPGARRAKSPDSEFWWMTLIAQHVFTDG